MNIEFNLKLLQLVINLASAAISFSSAMVMLSYVRQIRKHSSALKNISQNLRGSIDDLKSS